MVKQSVFLLVSLFHLSPISNKSYLVSLAVAINVIMLRLAFC